MTAKHKCSRKVPEGGRSVSFFPCQRPATVQRDGKWYCWQHDPIRVEADKQKRRARWDARHDRETAKWERRTRNAKLAALVTAETAELLERLGGWIEADAWTRWIGIETDCTQSHILAARIREALTQEAHDTD
jgi:hypothetical protein